VQAWTQEGNHPHLAKTISRQRKTGQAVG
jgi:hypothetical protein